jgi:hypothetical protein
MTDKPAPVRKWFPTGHLAWRKPLTDSWPSARELVQELFEVEILQEATETQGAAFQLTGAYEWRPIPILPPNPPKPVYMGGGRPMFDSTLINAAEAKP